MPSESDEIRKLLKQLYLLRLTLYLSFIVALGTTAFIFLPAFFLFSGYGPAAPAAQTTFATTTATLASTTATTVHEYSFDSWTDWCGRAPHAKPADQFRFDRADFLDSFWGGPHMAWARAISLGSKPLQL